MKTSAPVCWHIKAIQIVLGIALFSIPSSLTVRATDYYVSSTTGNDDNSPSTVDHPWQTIQKINDTTILPGDNIYFKCGDTWREMLTVTSGSQSGPTTTYTSYGTGPKPIISGAKVVDGWTVASGTAHTYQASLPTATAMVTSDNTYLKHGDSATTLAANQYFWAAGILYINIGADPTSPPRLIEAAQRPNAISNASSGAAPKTYYYHNSIIGLQLEKTNSSAITVQSSKFWTIQNCDLYFANSSTADGAGVNANNCDDMTVDHCHVNYALGDGILIYNSLRAIITNNLVENVLDDGVNKGGDCIQVEGNKGGHSTDGFQILHNVVSRPNVDVVKGCIIAQCGEGGIVSGNSTSGGKFGISVGGNNDTVSYNYVTAFGFYGGIRISRDLDLAGCQVIYNVVTNTVAPLDKGSAGVTITDDTLQHKGDPVGDHLANRSNFSILNNTFYNTYYGIIIESGGFSGKIENNISWNDAASSNVYRLKLTSSILTGESLTIDHNIWQYKTGSLYILFGATQYATLAAWQATGYDTHSSAADPLWANPALTDFHLQVGSPAIDTGDNVSLTRDYEGTTVAQGLAPDMGAFEYSQYTGSYAYEGFNYASATNLGGLNGGSGWASAWTTSGSSGNTKTTGTTLPFTGLPATGISIRLTGTATGTQTNARTLSRTFGSVQETYWISFLVKKLSATLEDHIAFGGLDFRALSGNPWQVKTPATAYTSTGASLTSVHLFLVRVDAGASSDTVRVWVDPVIASGEPALATATVTLTDSPGFTFNNVALSQSLNGDTSKATYYDELRLGGSFNSVVTGP